MKANAQAQNNIVIGASDSWESQEKQVLKQCQELLLGGKFAAIFCVAGGWAGGNVASENLVNSCETMWKQSVQSSIIAAKVASKFLTK